MELRSYEDCLGASTSELGLLTGKFEKVNERSNTGAQLTESGGVLRGAHQTPSTVSTGELVKLAR